MIRYQQLVDGVARRAGLAGPQEARDVTGAVLGALVRAAPTDDRLARVGAPPGRAGEPDRQPLARDLLGAIGRRLGRTAHQARSLTRAVLDELDAQDGDMVERIAAALPPATVDALRADSDG